jgi:hypothetical protein
MRSAITAECAITCDAPHAGMERKGSKMVLHWKSIPWARIVVDALLVLAILLASSSLLTVR